MKDVSIDEGTEKAAGGVVAAQFGATWTSQFLILMERSVRTRRLDTLGYEKFLQARSCGHLNLY